jgi:protocatechuate 3,4-dioxygenase, alpha subunit
MSEGPGHVATPSQTVGPFFRHGLSSPVDKTIVEMLSGGERIVLKVRVRDGDGVPVDDAVVEIWQAAGQASVPSPAAGFVRAPTDADGVCEMETVLPYATEGTSPHINVCLFARGLLRQVHTRIYFADDPTLAADPVLRLVPGDRRATLLARRDEPTGNRWTFDIRLQGPDETVFFDI